MHALLGLVAPLLSFCFAAASFLLLLHVFMLLLFSLLLLHPLFAAAACLFAAAACFFLLLHAFLLLLHAFLLLLLLLLLVLQYSSLAFHPDGMIMGGGGVDGNIYIWDMKGQQQRAALQGHSDRITKLTFSENGYYLATASADGTVINTFFRG